MANDTEQKSTGQSSAELRPQKRDISRRSVVVGLLGLAVAEAVAGGVTLQKLSQGIHKIALALAPPVPSPTLIATPFIDKKQAQALIQQYYNDINNKDYWDAYNLWRYAVTPGPNDYQNFANGYANTVHDDIIFDSTNLLPDGTVEMYITINATEMTTTGTVMNVYRARYVIGQVNGTWKILGGSAAKLK